MKYTLWCVFLLSLPVYGYAASNDNSCKNDNPYSQQLCEKLKQSSEAVRKEREEAYQKELAESEADVAKRIDK